MRVEAAVVATSERRREIEAEPVEPAVDHPSPQRADRHIDHERPFEGNAIAAAGVVEIDLRPAGVETEECRIVEATERQGRPELVALAVVVEDHVEDRLHARFVQRVSRRADFGPAAGREPRIGDAEHHGIVAPGVRQAERRQMPLVDERVGRHDLGCGYAEAGEMGDRSGVREPGEGSAQLFRNGSIEPRKAPQIELIDDERLRGEALSPGFAGRRRAGDRLRRMWTAVLAEGEHRGMQPERPVERPGIRVGQQLGRVEALTAGRVE